MNIKDFRSLIDRKGLLRNNRFMLKIKRIPPGISSAASNNPGSLLGSIATLNSAAQNDISMLCKATSLPGVLLNTTEVPRFGYGPVEKKVLNHSFTEINTEIMADRNGNNWRMIQFWIQLANNFDLRRGQGGAVGPGGLNFFENSFADDYKTEVTIEVYSEQKEMRPKISVELYEAFPISISDTQLNWGDTNNILTFNVNWAFYTWSIITNTTTDALVQAPATPPTNPNANIVRESVC